MSNGPSNPWLKGKGMVMRRIASVTVVMLPVYVRMFGSFLVIGRPLTVSSRVHYIAGSSSMMWSYLSLQVEGRKPIMFACSALVLTLKSVMWCKLLPRWPIGMDALSAFNTVVGLLMTLALPLLLKNESAAIQPLDDGSLCAPVTSKPHIEGIGTVVGSFGMHLFQSAKHTIGSTLVCKVSLDECHSG